MNQFWHIACVFCLVVVERRPYENFERSKRRDRLDFTVGDRYSDSDFVAAIHGSRLHIINDNLGAAWDAREFRFVHAAAIRPPLKLLVYGDAGAKISRRPKGTVMTVAFQLEGQDLNGGSQFKFTEAISFVVDAS